MTVAELIAELQKMPQDARVAVQVVKGGPHREFATKAHKVVIPVRSGPCAGGQELLVLLR